MHFEYCILFWYSFIPHKKPCISLFKIGKNKSFVLRLGIYNYSSSLIYILCICRSYTRLYLEI